MTETTQNPYRVGRKKVTDVAESKGKKGSDNFSEPHISMTFNVDPTWHSRFKVEAAMRGITMKELFLECFDIYLKEQREGRR